MKLNRYVARGFSLVELMVTLSLVAILAGIAVPSLSTFMRNAELTSFTNTLFSAINAARSEAMKHGRDAMVVPTDGASWDSGWIVFVDVDRSNTYAAASDITVLTSEAKPSYMTIIGNNMAASTPPYIRFDASGYSKPKSGDLPNLTLEIKRNDVSGSDLLSQTRRLKIAITGRVRVCTPKSTTDATCNMTSSF